ncbi:4-hydroxythreonine-4-phosphate dehydrogenase PdxA [Arenimonas sp. GDDSR-1]|uniref:4-hydroxythreonine-4-phosphate dehydrogenase PdxA n=1 Tax=Arenimonas sp. GDDSR-1 TaxID=2950125 RepID=UPI00260BE208|nr:4-hydroxythreonine-4-phosphate dehydrogenase PdxA [Arenimonas sp. GDDSR-1]
MAVRPHLALVPGEPSGIGPELCVRIAQREHGCHLTVLADPVVLSAAADAIGLPLRCKSPGEPCAVGELAVMPFPLPQPVHFGRLNPDNSATVIAALNRAGEACLQGEFDGLVTGPVHKAAVNAAGIAYTGTTELLAEQAGVPVVMMLATESLRVALATTHLPLREVPDALTPELLEQVLRIVRQDLRRHFGVPEPRMGVLGLNPHAGEDGLLGGEEIEVMLPVLEKLRAEGFLLQGPLPADTAFLPARLAQCDVIIAMYHDQGLPVLKFSGFDHAVNITLGLPYPRVAVDHGTALELAGTGQASGESLWQAIRLCRKLAAKGEPA